MTSMCGSACLAFKQLFKPVAIEMEKLRIRKLGNENEMCLALKTSKGVSMRNRRREEQLMNSIAQILTVSTGKKISESVKQKMSAVRECGFSKHFWWSIGYVALFAIFINFSAESVYGQSNTALVARNACEDVSKYYESLKGLKGAKLMKKLHNTISPHRPLPYNQVWNALQVLDAEDMEHPEKSQNVIEIYSLRPTHKTLAAKAEGWNREHLWPRSYGVHEEPELSDLHNLYPADVNVNSSRGNKYYAECLPTNKSCVRPANPEAAADTAMDKWSWMPPESVKGDVARAIMYMAVRYGFDQPSGRHNLQLSDSPTIANSEMGLLSHLLRWHEKDPPSTKESKRNDLICKIYQHNRNPFVDHPDYAFLIWGYPSKLKGN